MGCNFGHYGNYSPIYGRIYIRWEGDIEMTYLGIIFAVVVIISLACIIWIELDKKHFKNKKL